MEKHSDVEKLYSCDICYFKTARKIELPRHLKRKHRNESSLLILEREDYVEQDSNMKEAGDQEQILEQDDVDIMEHISEDKENLNRVLELEENILGQQYSGFKQKQGETQESLFEQNREGKQEKYVVPKIWNKPGQEVKEEQRVEQEEGT